MPTSNQILAGLAHIANQWAWLAILWHVYLGAIVLTLIIARRPSIKIVALLLTLPLFSVSALAWSIGNPFNGILFALAAIFTGIVSLKLAHAPVRFAPMWAVAVGILLFAFGWTYPHFVDNAKWWTYLYAAPTGLVPCPTLCAIAGLGLIFGGFNSRTWALVVGVMGLFYGVFGALRLNVTIDWVLFAGALVLTAYAFLVSSRRVE